MSNVKHKICEGLKMKKKIVYKGQILSNIALSALNNEICSKGTSLFFLQDEFRG